MPLKVTGLCNGLFYIMWIKLKYTDLALQTLTDYRNPQTQLHKTWNFRTPWWFPKNLSCFSPIVSYKASLSTFLGSSGLEWNLWWILNFSLLLRRKASHSAPINDIIFSAVRGQFLTLPKQDNFKIFKNLNIHTVNMHSCVLSTCGSWPIWRGLDVLFTMVAQDHRKMQTFILLFIIAGNLVME